MFVTGPYCETASADYMYILYNYIVNKINNTKIKVTMFTDMSVLTEVSDFISRDTLACRAITFSFND